jgi:hypothetical protein
MKLRRERTEKVKMKLRRERTEKVKMKLRRERTEKVKMKKRKAGVILRLTGSTDPKSGFQRMRRITMTRLTKRMMMKRRSSWIRMRKEGDYKFKKICISKKKQ